MNFGYVFLLLALTAFGTLGIFHKIADHPQCRPKMTALLLFFWGCVFSVIYTAAWDSKGMHFPGRVVLIGSFTGAIAALALFVFQTALRYGKISTSWLIVNLTSAVPVLVSILLFHEKLSVAKSSGILLVFIAIVLLWLDKRRDLQKMDPAQASEQKSKWLPLMLLTFLGQGLASTGSKVLVESGVGDFVWQFLIVLYGAGFLMMLLLSILREAWPNRREVFTATVMGLCSVAGNCGITMALKTVKGSIAYPVNNGSLLIVVIAGILFFKEKIHPVGFMGIVFGISAVLVLVLN
jgi:drug/metabolite transporter (DMT)-like permease